MRTWYLGRLREDFCLLQAGDLVFYRELYIRRPLAVGTCWWICSPSLPHRFFSVAESYGGKDLVNIVKGLRNQYGNKKSVSSEDQRLLENGLRNFSTSLPPEARPSLNPLPRPSRFSPNKEIP